MKCYKIAPLFVADFFFIYHHTVKTKEHTYTQNSKRLLSHKCPYIIYFYYDYNTLYRVLGWPEFSKQLLININKYLSVVEKRNIHIVNDERWWWVPILSKCFHTFWYKAVVLEATLALSSCKYLQVNLIYLTPLTYKQWRVGGETICLYVPFMTWFSPNLWYQIDDDRLKDGQAILSVDNYLMCINVIRCLCWLLLQMIWSIPWKSHWTFKNWIKFYFWDKFWLIYLARPEYSGFKTHLLIKASQLVLLCKRWYASKQE